ncbi:uncharacterized protein LOC130670537 [Microplitis mediator]|uniref:uncharacterized protein LOC130670537 n=1 Tax=Microplitis mediator TaxID=375433 RepID=UPI0025568ACB|nr:uncharacterized protein LOC130670537 [Microplitis mediator]
MILVMDFTKKYCCVERKKGDIAVYPTKYIYFKDENGFHSLPMAAGEVTTFYTMDNAKKPMANERLLRCDDDKDALMKSVNTPNRIKIIKSLFMEKQPENAKQKKLRITRDEKIKIILKKVST